MAIPFFIAAGIFMGAGGLSHRLLALADEVVGGLSGGIALASIATCLFFAAISGSGPATVAAIGTLTIPAMTERGYDNMFAAAVVASAGAIGVMIPPSNPFVVYGVAGQASVGKLFLAGITPGILTGLVLMLVAYCIAKKNGCRGAPRQSNLKTLGKAVWVAKGALLVPVIVLGGIYGEMCIRDSFYSKEHMGQTSPVCNKHRALHSQKFGFSGILIELSARHGGHGTSPFVETYLHAVRVVNPFLQHLTRIGHRVSQRAVSYTHLDVYKRQAEKKGYLIRFGYPFFLPWVQNKGAEFP